MRGLVQGLGEGGLEAGAGGGGLARGDGVALGRICTGGRLLFLIF